MSNRYTIYQGTFVCHVCKQTTNTLRSYPATKELTWMCKDNHISRVSLQTKKSKKDYERAERK